MAQRGRPRIHPIGYKHNGKRYEVRAEIMRDLTRYSDEVTENLEKLCRSLAKEGASTLKKTSPRGTKEHKHYADGWTSRVTKKDGRITATVYNKSKPGLTHLLEFGWIDKSGKRVCGEEHIGSVEKWMGKRFLQRVRELLGGEERSEDQ